MSWMIIFGLLGLWAIAGKLEEHAERLERIDDEDDFDSEIDEF